jgi:SAM-dependent methyltransferase
VDLVVDSVAAMVGSRLPPAPILGRLSAVELLELRDRLAETGLRDESGSAGVALEAGEVEAARRPMVLAALRDLGDTRALITRVFVYGDTASPAELSEALGAAAVDQLVACNLLRETIPGELDCPIQVRPVAGLLVASDRPGCAGQAVMPPGPRTAELTRSLPRPPLGKVLDLGTGSGLLALLAADGGATVTATDVNERACTFTSFNAAFNGLAVEVHAGDLFAPVEGEHFDLVLSQPPFVVQPPDVDATVFAHGGPRGDDLALRLLHDLDRVLAPGGCAVLRFDAPGTLSDVTSRVRSAVPHDVDVGVFGFKTVGSEMIALGYALLADPTQGSRYRREVTSYSRHMASLGLDRFTGTVTVVHRPEDQRLPVTVSAGGRSAPTWPYVTARLAGERLAAAPDSALLSAWLAPLPQARLTAELPLDHPDTGAEYALRYPSDAVPTDVDLDEADASMLQLFVGGRHVASAVEATSSDQRAPDVLAFARDALHRGLLVPVRTP